jgi:CheY-like chemotaxis protein
MELGGAGYHVLLAEDGDEAVLKSQAEQPDLVVLDICMPRMGGIEAMMAIRAIDPHLPVILLTAQLEGSLADPRAQHADALLEKSPDLAELKSVIAGCLNRSHSRGQATG